MPQAKVNLHEKRARLKELGDDPKAQKKVAKITARIQAGDNKSHETLFQRRKRLTNKLEDNKDDDKKGNAKQLKARLGNITTRIANPDPDDNKAFKKKPKMKQKPTMARPKTQREGFGAY